MKEIAVMLLVLVAAACTSLESSEPTQGMPVPGENPDEMVVNPMPVPGEDVDEMIVDAAGGTYLEGEAPDKPAEKLIAE